MIFLLRKSEGYLRIYLHYECQWIISLTLKDMPIAFKIANNYILLPCIIGKFDIAKKWDLMGIFGSFISLFFGDYCVMLRLFSATFGISSAASTTAFCFSWCFFAFTSHCAPPMFIVCDIPLNIQPNYVNLCSPRHIFIVVNFKCAVCGFYGFFCLQCKICVAKFE